jgi:hypothetical protein
MQPHLEKPSQKRAQGVGFEFKSQHHKNKNSSVFIYTFRKMWKLSQNTFYKSHDFVLTLHCLRLTFYN